MTLATGNPTGNATDRTGFTLIEIVLVLGLMALATAAMVINMATLVNRGDTLTAEETLSAAVRKARFIAASERTTTQLSFNKEGNSLEISRKNSEIESFELDDSFKEDRSAEIRFYLIAASRGLVPAGDPARADLETPAVEFASDRSASPFVAEIDLGRGTPERLQFDPFSSLQITSP